MLVHIEQMKKHAISWLADKGHAIDSEMAAEVQGLLNHIVDKTQVEQATEYLKSQGYTVTPPEAKTA